jgi:L-ascorbate metabolism protein UlaG (beta-lactamase superfamily)
MSLKQKDWSIRLLRHATLVIEKDNTKFLVDPMLSPKNAMDPVGNAGNDTRIPMVDLPLNNDELSQLLKDVDAVLVTHTHRDHWDAVAQQMIDKSKPLFCQPSDLEKIKGQGFTNVTAIEAETKFNNITIHRTGGQHGTGEIGQKMGVVSGFVLEHKNSNIYIAGDTIWCSEVDQAINTFKPQVAIVNAGGAQFLSGGPITMNAADVKTVANAMSGNKVVAVHMDTVNHCIVTRPILAKFIAENNLTNVVIPGDGATLTF